MKKIVLSGLLLISTITSLYAQIYTPSGTIQGSSNNNNVGIGTPTPTAKLDVYSNANLGIRYSGIRIHRPGEFGQFAFIDYNVNGDVSFFGSSYTGAIGQYGKISFRQYTQGDVYRDAMYIDNSGYVGIGTTSPSGKLDVYSDIDLGIRYSGIRTHRPGGYGQFAFMDYNVNGDVSFFGSSYTGAVGQYGKISFRQYTQGNVYRDAMYINNSGNVGIGTTSPNAKLDVYSDIDLGIRYGGIRTHRPGAFGQFAFMDYNVNGDISFFGSSYTGGAGQYGKISFRQYTQGDVYRDAMYINNSGNVGIGTTSPNAKLDVYSDIDLGIRYGGIRTHRPGAFGQFAFMDYNVNGDISFFGSSYTGGAGQYGKISFRQYTQGDVYRDAMYIDNLGNVGIGTTKPDSKLTVNGKIHATEVQVTQSVPADYVFEKYYLGQSSLKPDYTLLTLSEVEKFTEANHHLPNVPSAKEIKENGLLLGEMSNILLQKIEELTLYSIEQQKKLDEQNKAIEAQNETMETQNNTLHNLQKLIETLAERLTRLERK
jgi:hypothetical protein